MKPAFEVHPNKKVRVIIDTDCMCEADDQFALAQAVLSPKLDIVGISAVHFRAENSTAQSHDEILHVLDLMQLAGRYPVLMGCEGPLAAETQSAGSNAAKFIVEQALANDPRPLFYLGMGALTNLADAYLLEPAIANRVTAIWIGGARYPDGGWEHNLLNDVHAANVVMDSGMELWQVPMNVFSMMKVSIYTLFERVWPCGDIGRYLVENLVNVSTRVTGSAPFAELNLPEMSDAAKAAGYPSGESWQLGDNPAVGLLLSDHAGNYEVTGAPRFTPSGQYVLRPNNPHRIRVYNYVDSHFILDDMYAKLRYHYAPR